MKQRTTTVLKQDETPAWLMLVDDRPGFEAWLAARPELWCTGPAIQREVFRAWRTAVSADG